MNTVILNKKAQKQIKKVPAHIARKLLIWAEQVEMLGIEEIRKIPGIHDEPLRGNRENQRSIRLSKSYRAFYIEHDDTIVIEVIEVNKHDYR
ncbi:MAG: type II toxin-antitoxin system mRNA interferase toxin, RelE/StbE family [Desulfobacterales bacterium]|nr:type II toxin-antitoxin system mRNA interferase toxin, RelE/StbE family [Desulfobacterales bacterium]